LKRAVIVVGDCGGCVGREVDGEGLSGKAGSGEAGDVGDGAGI